MLNTQELNIDYVAIFQAQMLKREQEILANEQQKVEQAVSNRTNGPVCHSFYMSRIIHKISGTFFVYKMVLW